MCNIDEWKWKLSLLLRSEKDQEIVSRDKRDRRDYEQISNLAKKMGLYWWAKHLRSILLLVYNVLAFTAFFFALKFCMCSEIYGKVTVASKVPLPNYRPDLDDKRPQREVNFWLLLEVSQFYVYGKFH